jgi:predicted NBD/HSP70 family sugar kinase
MRNAEVRIESPHLFLLRIDAAGREQKRRHSRATVVSCFQSLHVWAEHGSGATDLGSTNDLVHGRFARTYGFPQRFQSDVNAEL